MGQKQGLSEVHRGTPAGTHLAKLSAASICCRAAVLKLTLGHVGTGRGGL